MIIILYSMACFFVFFKSPRIRGIFLEAKNVHSVLSADDLDTHVLGGRFTSVYLSTRHTVYIVTYKNIICDCHKDRLQGLQTHWSSMPH